MITYAVTNQGIEDCQKEVDSCSTAASLATLIGSAGAGVLAVIAYACSYFSSSRSHSEIARAGDDSATTGSGSGDLAAGSLQSGMVHGVQAGRAQRPATTRPHSRD